MSEKGTINKPHKGGAVHTSKWVYIFKESRNGRLNGVGNILDELFR